MTDILLYQRVIDVESCILVTACRAMKGLSVDTFVTS